MIQRYDHTSFTVADIDRAVVFWRDVMGFALGDLSAREGDWLGGVVGVPGARCRIAHLHGHGLHLELIQYLEPVGPDVTGPPHRPGTAHLAFLVEDIETAARRMLEGGASEQGRVTRCASGTASGCLAVYLRDPSGIIVELVEPVAAGDAERRRSAGSSRRGPRPRADRPGASTPTDRTAGRPHRGA